MAKQAMTQQEKDELKDALRRIAPYAVTAFIAYKLGKRSVKIPPEAIPTTIRLIDKLAVVTMSNGLTYTAEIPEV